jgi:S1-C subfamily serine protease
LSGEKISQIERIDSTMEALMEVSNAMADAVQVAQGSVVRVEGRRRLPASGIVWSPDGLILTANHVVEQDESIGVGLPDGRTVAAELAGRDPATDLALLRADVTGLMPPTWAESDVLQVGHLVLALGRPGRREMATLGIVSALGEPWRTPAGGEIDRYLQTDVVMYPGFSGGMLVNAVGAGLGLNTSALLRGVSVSIPYSSLLTTVGALQTHGRVRRGYLGVHLQPVKLSVRIAKQLDQETGVMLIAVEEGSPAENGGLLQGDAIVAFDGEPVRRLDDLMILLGRASVDEEVSVRIVRGGEMRDMKVVLGERR